MKKYIIYKVSAFDIQRGQRVTFNTFLYNCYDYLDALKFLQNMKKNGSEFYCSFHLVKVECKTIEVTQI